MKRIYFYGMLGLVIVSAATGRCEACETAPVAEIVSPSSGHAACVGCAVSFDAVGSGSTGSHDPDNGEPAGGGHGITKYEWHWGDEGPGDPYWHNAGGTPSHTYSTGGSYTVWLRVTDDDSPSQTDTTSCTVHAVRVLSIVSKDVACVNEDITFTVTTDPAGHEGPVTWSGGETPATGSGKTFTTRWSTVGPKQVTAECGSSSVSKTIDVIDGLTVLPREAYVCVDDTKWFKAWGCAGGVATDVTSVATFSTSNGSMQTGGGSPSGPGNNILHPSSGSSCEKTCDWVKATYNSVTTDDDHDCDLTVVEVTITDWAGNPITTTQTVCVGQKISLKGKVEPSTMTGTWQWIIPGTVVKDYKKEPLSGPPAGRTKAWVVPLTAADKEQSTIEFYWVDGGDGRGVTLTWTESSGEISCSDDAGFDVKRPSLDSFTSETGPIGVGDPWLSGGPYLYCGTPTEPGIEWTASVTLPADFGGQIKFTQVVESDWQRAKTDSSTESRKVPAWWLDADPYDGPWTMVGGGSLTKSSGDSPAIPLVPGYKKMNNKYWHFEAYVMFRSVEVDTIWVPIGKLQWGWSGIAQSTDGGTTWTLVSGAHDATDPDGSTTTDFPEWSDTVIPAEEYPPWIAD